MRTAKSVTTALLLAATTTLQGAIVLSGDFVNATSTPTLTITQDINFLITRGEMSQVCFSETGCIQTERKILPPLTCRRACRDQ